jgi:hypothetical protein
MCQYPCNYPDNFLNLKVPMRERLINGVEMLAGAAQLSLDFGYALLDVVVDAISGREVPQAEPKKHAAVSVTRDVLDVRRPPRPSASRPPAKIA